MFDKIEQGIDFEWEFKEILEEYAKGGGRFGLHDSLNVAVLPESGRVAAKDGYKIGDIVLGWRYCDIMFVDCTSVYSRSDNREKIRLNTKNKDLPAMIEYIKILNTHNDNNKNIPTSIVKKYDHLRGELAEYLDQTFEVDNVRYLDDGTEYKSYAFWHPKWHKCMRVNYWGAMAWKYGGDIFVTLINPQTIKALGKSDPEIDDILPLSFTLPGFVWFLQDNESYFFLGKEDCTMENVMAKSDKDFEEYLKEEGE